MRGLARDRDKRFDSFQKMRLDLLALMEPEREIASLPRRVVALIIDWALVWLVARIVLFGGTLLLGLDLDESERWETLVCSLAWFGYLWLTEWLLGYTLGKRCLKIKVVARQTGLRQSPVKLWVRRQRLSCRAKYCTLFNGCGWDRTQVSGTRISFDFAGQRADLATRGPAAVGL